MSAAFYNRTLIAASVFASFHIVAVALPVLSSHGQGETQAFAVMIFDIPLVWLLSVFGGRAVLNGGPWYVAIFSVVGTLMYAVMGALLGFFVDRLRVRFRKK